MAIVLKFSRGKFPASEREQKKMIIAVHVHTENGKVRIYSFFAWVSFSVYRRKNEWWERYVEWVSEANEGKA